MSKLPYIPLYTGDHLKDTRTLTLAAKGAWSDLIIFMWCSEQRGILEGRNSDFARMVGATPEEFASVLLELCSKKICDKIELGGGLVRLVCRRQVRDAEISAKKALNGSKGGSKTQANRAAKNEQNSEYEIEYETEAKSNKELFEKKFTRAFDEWTLEEYSVNFKGLDLGEELRLFKMKCNNDPQNYHTRDTGGLRNGFQHQLQSSFKRVLNTSRIPSPETKSEQIKNKIANA